MAKVLNLDHMRRQKRQAYLQHHGKRLDRFIKAFIRDHWTSDLETITSQYLERCSHSEAWDYLDLRDDLHEIVRSGLAEHLRSELQKTHWFDASKISMDELADRCLTTIVLEDWAAIS